MVMQLNGKEVKEKILKYLEEKGPSLPIPVAKHMSMSTLFVSAFLSEMASDGMIKISNMKVGGSPLYYPPSKVNMLENFTKFLGGREIEAHTLLREKGILNDEEQTPIIRVALRSLKDFAISFKNDDKNFWRYFTLSEEEVRKRFEQKSNKKEVEPKETFSVLGFEKPEVKKEVEKIPEKIIQKIIPKIEAKLDKKEVKKEIEAKKNLGALGEETELEKIKQEIEEKKLELEKINQVIEVQQKLGKTPLKKDKISKKLRPKKPLVDETFLNEIKQMLEKRRIVLLTIESFDKKEALLRINKEGREILLAAYNRKTINEAELLKLGKKASLMNLPFQIMLKELPSKKIKEAHEIYKRLESIDLLE